jgi:hypothetical protein
MLDATCSHGPYFRGGVRQAIDESIAIFTLYKFNADYSFEENELKKIMNFLNVKYPIRNK